MVESEDSVKKTTQPWRIKTKMKKILSSMLALMAVAGLALADSDVEASAKDTKKMVQNNFVETAQKGVKLSGYVDVGYSYNFNSNLQQKVVPRFGSDTAYGGDFNLYAVKLALEKAMSNENKAQAGFRADVMIGEDASYLADRTTGMTRSNNDSQDSNSLFLEQAYVSIRAPVGNGWDFKVGKFVSILGYEVIERPANMNITYGLLWQQFPLYYTGVLSSYRFDDYLDAKLGVVNGSNSDNNTTTGLGGDGCAVLAALNVTAPGGNANWSNNFQWSTNSENNSSDATQSDGNSTPVGLLNGTSGSGYVFIYNSWGNWAPKFADDKLLLAFNAVLGTANSNDANVSSTFMESGGTTWYGAGAYAKYQFNDWFYLANRGEYLGGNNLGKISNTQFYANGGMSLWEYTLTAGFNVIDNLLIRAEYRMDWGRNSTQSGINPANNKFLFNSSFGSGPSYYAGAEVVYSF
jgi:hypothetical protein